MQRGEVKFSELVECGGNALTVLGVERCGGVALLVGYVDRSIDDLGPRSSSGNLEPGRPKDRVGHGKRNGDKVYWGKGFLVQRLVGGRAEAGGNKSQTDCPCHQMNCTVKEMSERMR